MNLLEERLKKQKRKRLQEEAARAGQLPHQDDLLEAARARPLPQDDLLDKSNNSREDSGSSSFTELSIKPTTNTLPPIPKKKPLTEDRLCECDELMHCSDWAFIMYV